jgi:hypothetical protein
MPDRDRGERMRHLEEGAGLRTSTTIAGEKVIRGGQAVVKSVRARDAGRYGPTFTIFATDGTPAAFSTKSM